MKPRVVFIPGIMGSALIDNSITQGRKRCKDNIGGIYTAYKWIPNIKLEPEPCASDLNFKSIWGKFDSLDWILNPPDWEARLMSGWKGYDEPGSVCVQPRSGLVEIALQWRYLSGLHTFKGQFDYNPYKKIRGLVAKDDVDGFVFPYDWRLSNTYNAKILAEEILIKWWDGQSPNEVFPQERITIIAHSLGGLVARYYLESEEFHGSRFVHQLITVGTPHLGSPEAYTHFLGVTRPFEIPFFKGLADIFDNPDFNEFPMPSRMQERLVRFFASVIEMLPVYDFVCYWDHKCKKQRYEAHDQTYNRRHSIMKRRHKSGRKYIDILSSFREGLVNPNQIGCWLEENQIKYYLIGISGVDTIVGFNAAKKKVIRSGRGDGVVPLKSALMGLQNTTTTNLKTVPLRLIKEVGTDIVPSGEGVLGQIQPEIIPVVEEVYEHSELFLAKSVITYCRDRIKVGPPPKPQSSPKISPISTDNDILFSLGKSIRKASIYSIIRLKLKKSNRLPVLDLKIRRNGSNEFVTGISGLMEKGLIKETKIFNRKYVSTLPAISHRTGGVIFLPDSCQDYIEMVTWNIGPLDRNNNNQTHAEVQFLHWLRQQNKAWLERLFDIEIENKGGRSGNSPCCQCCVDLIEIRNELPAKCNLSISWQNPYVYNGKSTRHYTTTRKSLNRMQRVGWSIDNDLISQVQYRGKVSDEICDGI